MRLFCYRPTKQRGAGHVPSAAWAAELGPGIAAGQIWWGRLLEVPSQASCHHQLLPTARPGWFSSQALRDTPHHTPWWSGPTALGRMGWASRQPCLALGLLLDRGPRNHQTGKPGGAHFTVGTLRPREARGRPLYLEEQ